MTACCGLANGFWSLFGARMGVGLGEAALSPAAYSMIARLVSPCAACARDDGVFRRRSGRVRIGADHRWAGSFTGQSMPGRSCCQLSAPCGGWQMAFFIVSLPGVAVLALLACIREPARRETVRASARQKIGMRDLLRNRSKVFFLATMGFAFQGIAFVSYLAWGPTVLIRHFGWTAPQAGLALGIMMLLGSTSGTVVGGIVADRLTERGFKDASLRTAIGSILVVLPFRIDHAVRAEFLLGGYAIGRGDLRLRAEQRARRTDVPGHGSPTSCARRFSRCISCSAIRLPLSSARPAWP